MSRNSSNTARDYARRLLDKLVDLDQSIAGAYYEMGRMLESLRRDRLWGLLGYKSFGHLIEEELSYSITTAGKYAFTYRRFRMLGYTEREAKALLSEFGIARIADWLSVARSKVGKRAVSNAIRKIKDENHQVNFMVNSAEYARVCAALEKFGASRNTDSGYLTGSSEAFVALIESAVVEDQPARRLRSVQ